MAGDKESGSNNGLIAALISVGVVGLVAVVLAAMALGSGAGDGSAATPPAATTRPSIVMGGTGSVVGVPDQLSFTVRVTLTRSDVAVAMDDASRTMKKVIASTAKDGVAKKDVQTTGLSIDPSYDYSGNTERLVGYTVSQSAKVRVDDLRKAGRTLADAAAAGGNDVRINGVSLGIANRDALLVQARRAAVTDAKAKAQAYAAAGGQRLGRMLSLKEVSTVAPTAQSLPYAAKGLMDMTRAAAAVPIRAGQKSLKVQIQVVWELE